MEYFFSSWEAIKDRISDKTLMLFFDFDGTLAPIAPTPEKAQLPQRTLDSLRTLSENKSCKVAIVSGRALSDVERKVGIEAFVYVGNHGLEIQGRGIQHSVAISDTYLETLQTVKIELLAMIVGYKGVLVEDKGLSLSVHFRLVESAQIIELHNKIRAVLFPYLSKALIKVKSGKMVFEVRPPIEWGKGEAVLWLIDQWRAMIGNDPALALYCGDDATDEDAFKVLKNKGLTIVVGAHDASAAHYYLNTQEEVNKLLDNIIELKSVKQ